MATTIQNPNELEANPVGLKKESITEEESEGMFPVRDMLKTDLENERKRAIQLRDYIPVATRESDFATETLLKQVLIRVEDRAHHLDHYLAADSLEDGR